MSKAWDGEISDSEAEQLATHLRICPECVDKAEKMRTFLARLDQCLKADTKRNPENRPPSVTGA